MTNDQKSRVIAEKVGIHWHEKAVIKEEDDTLEFNRFNCSCGTKNIHPPDYGKHTNPNFFHPDIKERRNAQAILAGALLEERNKELYKRFTSWVVQWANNKNLYIISELVWLEIIAETNFAELFFEFLEGEKDV